MIMEIDVETTFQVQSKNGNGLNRIVTELTMKHFRKNKLKNDPICICIYKYC